MFLFCIVYVVLIVDLVCFDLEGVFRCFGRKFFFFGIVDRVLVVRVVVGGVLIMSVLVEV